MQDAIYRGIIERRLSFSTVIDAENHAREMTAIQVDFRIHVDPAPHRIGVCDDTIVKYTDHDREISFCPYCGEKISVVDSPKK